MGRLALLELEVEGSLLQCLSMDGLLLLPKMGRDIREGRGNTECLMKSSLDRHRASVSNRGSASAEPTTVLLLSAPVLLLSCLSCVDEVESVAEDGECTSVGGGMTDGCSTEST